METDINNIITFFHARTAKYVNEVRYQRYYENIDEDQIGADMITQYLQQFDCIYEFGNRNNDKLSPIPSIQRINGIIPFLRNERSESYLKLLSKALHTYGKDITSALCLIDINSAYVNLKNCNYENVERYIITLIS